MDSSKDNSNLQNSIDFADEVSSGQQYAHQNPQQRQSLNRPLIGIGQAQTANQNRATQSRPSQYRDSNSFPRRPNTNHVAESEYDDAGGVSPYVHLQGQGQGKQGDFSGQASQSFVAQRMGSGTRVEHFQRKSKHIAIGSQIMNPYTPISKKDSTSQGKARMIYSEKRDQYQMQDSNSRVRL